MGVRVNSRIIAEPVTDIKYTTSENTKLEEKTTEIEEFNVAVNKPTKLEDKLTIIVETCWKKMLNFSVRKKQDWKENEEWLKKLKQIYDWRTSWIGRKSIIEEIEDVTLFFEKQVELKEISTIIKELIKHRADELSKLEEF